MEWDQSLGVENFLPNCGLINVEQQGYLRMLCIWAKRLRFTNEICENQTSFFCVCGSSGGPSSVSLVQWWRFRSSLKLALPSWRPQITEAWSHVDGTRIQLVMGPTIFSWICFLQNLNSGGFQFEYWRINLTVWAMRKKCNPNCAI